MSLRMVSGPFQVQAHALNGHDNGSKNATPRHNTNHTTAQEVRSSMSQ